MPTGGDTSAINPSLSRISSGRTAPSNSNRNTITVEDVKTTTVFERQLNAAKALANLLDIVKQATANKNAAKEEIVKREELLAIAKANYIKAQDGVAQAEKNLTRIKGGIESINNDINSIKTSLAEFENRAAALRLQRDSLNQNIGNANLKLRGVQGRLTAAENRLNGFNGQAQSKDNGCNSIRVDLANAEGDLSKNNLDRDNTVKDLASANSVAALQAQRVEDLRRQLAEAEAKLDSDKKEVLRLEQRKANLDFTIKSTQDKIAALKVNSQQCLAEL